MNVFDYTSVFFLRLNPGVPVKWIFREIPVSGEAPSISVAVWTNNPQPSSPLLVASSRCFRRATVALPVYHPHPPKTVAIFKQHRDGENEREPFPVWRWNVGTENVGLTGEKRNERPLFLLRPAPLQSEAQRSRRHVCCCRSGLLLVGCEITWTHNRSSDWSSLRLTWIMTEIAR